MSALGNSSITNASASSWSPMTLTFLQRHVHQTTGIVLDSDKEYLLQSRIAPLLVELQLNSVDHLCDALRREPGGQVSRRMVDAITTNETLFFRDFATFEALRKEIGPELISKSRGRKLRVWSAAASSGQEAYSVAMLLLEIGLPASQIEILGTDISDEILDKARSGTYGQFEVNRGLPSSLLMKYFDRKGLSWQVKPGLRSMVTFRQCDLRRGIQDQAAFDLVLCRNVLIYFNQETKRNILNHLAGRLAEHGVLMLGCAETLIHTNVALHRRMSGGAAFYTR